MTVCLPRLLRDPSFKLKIVLLPLLYVDTHWTPPRPRGPTGQHGRSVRALRAWRRICADRDFPPDILQVCGMCEALGRALLAAYQLRLRLAEQDMQVREALLR